MFLFKSNNESPKETVNNEENFDNVVVESIYVVFINEEPYFYGKDKIETFKKIEEIVNGFKTQLILKNYIPTVELQIILLIMTNLNMLLHGKRSKTIK